jgi:acyl carrier protein
MNEDKIKDIIKIISKNTGIDKDLIDKKTLMTDFPKWDSIAQVKIMVELEAKMKKKISTSKMSELKSVLNIIKFLDK